MWDVSQHPVLLGVHLSWGWRSQSPQHPTGCWSKWCQSSKCLLGIGLLQAAVFEAIDPPRQWYCSTPPIRLLPNSSYLDGRPCTSSPQQTSLSGPSTFSHSLAKAQGTAAPEPRFPGERHCESLWPVTWGHFLRQASKWATWHSTLGPPCSSATSLCVIQHGCKDTQK